MVKVLVVYDSVFGNTEQVARAIGDALSAGNDVQVLRVGDVKPEHRAGLDLLFVGSPTRAFSPTPAVKKWLGSLPRQALQGVRVAAFDTRMNVQEVPSRLLHVMAGIFGYAAEPMAKRLQSKGGRQAVTPAGFLVKGSEGPLQEGELERAAEWARQAAG